MSFDEEISDIFSKLNFKAKLVGGCVRDFILYKKLVDDIDIATVLVPNDVIKLLENSYKVIPTGIDHGTVTVLSKSFKNRKYEITTLRSDLNTDGRHAKISFNTSYEQDSIRRDFTINALYLDLDGNIYDYQNGLLDLENKIVRFIGDSKTRINEDYLRILRFFRFSIRFDQFFEDDLKVCFEMKDFLLKISKERIFSEWEKILESPNFINHIEKINPILESLNFNTNIKLNKNFNELSFLAKCSLFFNESSHVCLSNVNKKYIKNLQTIKIDNQDDAIFWAKKISKEFVSDKMKLEDKFFEIIEIKPMPINALFLIQNGVLNIHLKETLEKLEKIWIKNKGEISTEELIKNI